MSLRRIMSGAAAVVFFCPAPGLAAGSDAARAFAGKWDLTVTGPDGHPHPSWLEITREDGAIKARMVGQSGSVFPVPEAAIENKELVWKTISPATPPVTTVYRGKVKNKVLSGTVTVGDAPPVSWTAVRAPKWNIAKGDAASRNAGRPVMLFNGTDATGWLPAKKIRSLGWIVKDGVLQTDGKSNNITSDRKFADFKLEAEFAISPGSNSGIYLRGRYEIQVLDDAGKPPSSHGNGGIYGFLTPTVNASRPAGEWQTVLAMLVGNRVTIVLNGTTIIDDEEIPGITGSALDSDEDRPGPIMLQGDHGPVKFRKLVVTPLR